MAPHLPLPQKGFGYYGALWISNGMAHASCAGLGSKIAHLLLISLSDITKFPPSDNSAGTHMVECVSIMLVLP